jgi:putative FmdB family regulatory protein
MPIHVFECEHCHHEFEVVTLSFKQEPDPTCKTCSKPAARRFGVPRAKTDALKGQVFGGDQFGNDEKQRKAALRAARIAGVNTNGMMYMNGLARFPHDPEAWVANKAEAKKKLEERGWGCDELGVKLDIREAPVQPTVAEDLVDKELNEMVAAGIIEKKDRKKKRAEVRDRILPDYNRPGAKVRALPERVAAKKNNRGAKRQST